MGDKIQDQEVVGAQEDLGVPASPSGHSAEPEPVPVSAADAASVPNAWIEFRPEANGKFDELVATFGDGLVHAEMMDDSALYVGLYWDDGRYCQVWINSKKKLRVSHEHGQSDPPRYTAQGVDRKPWLPDYSASAMSAGTAETAQQAQGQRPASAVAEGETPKPSDADTIARLEAEVERLSGCLERANASAERFEREWYLRGDLIREMREGLEPFAKAAEPYRGNQDAAEVVLSRGPFFGKDDYPPRFTVGDFRRARALVQKAKEESAISSLVDGVE